MVLLFVRNVVVSVFDWLFSRFVKGPIKIALNIILWLYNAYIYLIVSAYNLFTSSIAKVFNLFISSIVWVWNAIGIAIGWWWNTFIMGPIRLVLKGIDWLKNLFTSSIV